MKLWLKQNLKIVATCISAFFVLAFGLFLLLIKNNISAKETEGIGYYFTVYLNPGDSTPFATIENSEYYQSEVKLPSESETPVGYDFGGYYIYPDGQGMKFYDAQGNFLGSTSITSDVRLDLYAYWIPEVYNVYTVAHPGAISNSNSWGTSVDSYARSSSISYNSTYGTLPTPSRDGYTFNGWHQSIANGVSVSNSTAYDAKYYYLTEPLESNTLYGFTICAKKSYNNNDNVALYFDGGWITVSTQKVGAEWTTWSGIYQTGDVSTYTHGGKQMATLFNMPSGNCANNPLSVRYFTLYKINDASPAVDSTTVMTRLTDHALYAKWTANTYNLNFIHNINSDNSITDEQATASASATYDAVLPAIIPPVKHGCIFKGYFDANGTQYYDNYGKGLRNFDVASHLTLYAQYEEDTWAMNAVQPEGEGTEANPYKIASAANLGWIANRVDWMDNDIYYRHFIQTADIDLSGHYWLPIGRREGNAARVWHFAGYYNGNGFKIKNISTYTGVDTFYVALFGLPSGGKLSNIVIESGTIEGTTVVGGIAGWSNCMEIDNCVNYATVKGKELVGGIIGEYKPIMDLSLNSSITNCTNAGPVIAENKEDSYIGGIAGKIEPAYQDTDATNDKELKIVKCINTGSVTGNNYVGGIAGQVINSTIDSCMNMGNVTGNQYVGGIVAIANNATISKCYASCNVSSNDYHGGILGRTNPVSTNIVTVTNCMFSGTISKSGNYYALIVGAVGSGSTANIRDCLGKTTGDVALMASGDGTKNIESSLSESTSGKYYYQSDNGFMNWALNNGNPVPKAISWIGQASPTLTTAYVIQNYSMAESLTFNAQSWSGFTINSSSKNTIILNGTSDKTAGTSGSDYHMTPEANIRDWKTGDKIYMSLKLVGGEITSQGGDGLSFIIGVNAWTDNAAFRPLDSATKEAFLDGEKVVFTFECTKDQTDVGFHLWLHSNSGHYATFNQAQIEINFAYEYI